MNTKRILTWGGFIVVVGLIIWGLVAANNKAKQEEATLGTVDEVVAGDWVSSTSTVTVTIIEYSDFECPACAAYYPLIERLLRENPDKVRLVYRHFPLSQHPHAIPAAKASEAAGKQGKFWEMYRKIFETQAQWQPLTSSAPVFAGYAQELGLDMEQYNNDMNSQEIDEKINNDLKSGLKAGVNATPTFYVNGEKISNPGSYEEFQTIIDQAAADNS